VDVKIEDVAREAGVSRATVSRVINDSDSVKAKTAEHVLKTMTRLGYSPSARRPGPKPKNAHRSHLRQGFVALIAIGGTSELLQEPTMVMVIEHLRAECRKRQINLLLDQVTEAGQIPLCVQTQQIDGAILMLSGRSDYQRKAIAELSALVPCVHLFAPGHPVSSVDHTSINDVATGALAFQTLRERGCKSFVAVNVNNQMHEALAVRGRAFLDRVQNHDLPGLCLALKMKVGQNSRVWAPPLKEYDTLSDLPAALLEAHRQLPAPVGYFLTLEEGAPKVHEALNGEQLFSRGEAHLAIAGTTPYFVKNLIPTPILIDLRFAKLASVALDRLIHRALHSPEDGLTLLLSPELVENNKPEAPASPNEQEA
jgi:LacI family transcriptional regulator